MNTTLRQRTLVGLTVLGLAILLALPFVQVSDQHRYGGTGSMLIADPGGGQGNG